MCCHLIRDKEVGEEDVGDTPIDKVMVMVVWIFFLWGVTLHLFIEKKNEISI